MFDELIFFTDSQEYFEEFKRQFCRVLGCNGTLESRLCSERNSALCIISNKINNYFEKKRKLLLIKHYSNHFHFLLN